MADVCTNCSAPLAEGAKFCHECGQDQRDRIVPIGQLVSDILRDLFAFDTKFFRTLPALMTKPGFLAEEFTQGRRVRYIPAVRMYIFISVVAFLIFSMGGTPVVVEGKMVDADEGTMQISGMNETMDLIDSVGVDEWKAQIDAAGTFESIGAKFALINYEGRMPLFLERFRRQLPIAIFLVIPLLALVIKLLFRKRYYVEHLIFVFHLGSFVLLTAALAHLISLPFSIPGLVTISFALGLIYLFIGTRRYYKAGIMKTLFTVLISAFMGALFVIATTSVTALYSLGSM